MMFNFFDIISLVILFILGYVGYRRGLIGEASKFVGLVLGIYFAATNYNNFSNYFSNFFKDNPGVRQVLGFILIFLVVYFLIEIGGSLVSKTLQKIKLGWINKSLGGMFGFLKGAVLILVLVWGIYSFQQQGLHKNLKANSIVYSIFNDLRRVIGSNLNFNQRVDQVKKKINQKKIDSLKKNNQ